MVVYLAYAIAFLITLSIAFIAPTNDLVMGRKQAELREAYFSGLYEIVCVSSGRQAGKTYAGAIVSRDWLLKGPNDSMYWMIAPSMKLTKAAHRRIISCLVKSGVPRSDLSIHNSNNDISIRYKPRNTYIEFRTAKQQGFNVGETLSGLWIDEAGKIVDSMVLYEDLLPACAVMNAVVLITGTPKKAAIWYKNIFFSGLKDSPRYRESGFKVKSLHMTARDNPAGGGIVGQYLKFKKMSQDGLYPMDTFLQEWDGEWVDSGGLIFRNLDQAVAMGHKLRRREWERVEHGHIVSADIGTSRDYATACVFADKMIMDPDTGKKILVCKHSEKIPHMDFAKLSRRLHQICVKWGGKHPARIVMDGTGLPDATKRTLANPVIFDENDQEKKVGLRVYWHIWDHDNRNQAIGQTQSLLDTHRLAIPEEYDLLEELQGFEEKQLPSGKIKIEAREGIHDDLVMALIQGVHILGSRWRPVRFLSDEYAARENVVDYRGGPDSKERYKKREIEIDKKRELPKMTPRRPGGRTGGFFD